MKPKGEQNLRFIILIALIVVIFIAIINSRHR